jgi:hypothetical protein
MRAIPLNFQTMYADLLQSIALAPGEDYGSVSVRRVRGHDYLYVTSKDGATRRQRVLGSATDPAARAKADTIRAAAQRARARRTTVSSLKRAHIPSPSLPLGRVLEAMSNARLFERGAVLIGTAAYQTYSCAVGAYLSSSSLMTNDADLLVSSFVATDAPLDLEMILRRANPTFKALMSNSDDRPKNFRSDDGFQVDVLTKFGRNRKSPIRIDGLQCSAEALKFMEYLVAAETLEAVALYGAGVLVQVPQPGSYAIHKLLIAQERRGGVKRNKDLVQARDLIDVFMATSPTSFEEDLGRARARGPSWRRNIDASLREIELEFKQSRLVSTIQVAQAPGRSPKT